VTVAEDPQNIVMVTADSLRADHCGFIDSSSSLTPTIDRLAAEGVSYSEAIAPGPRTPSSVPVLFTGEFMTDDEEWSMADWQGRQSRIGRHMDRFRHVSERLQRRGYETAVHDESMDDAREQLPPRVRRLQRDQRGQPGRGLKISLRLDAVQTRRREPQDASR